MIKNHNNEYNHHGFIEDAALAYQLDQSIPAFNQILSLDEEFRITQGNFGTRMVHARVGNHHGKR